MVSVSPVLRVRVVVRISSSLMVIVGVVSASENLCVFFRCAVFIEGCLVGVRGWFLLFLACWFLCLRVVGVVCVYGLLVVVLVVAAGFAARARGPSFVGALAVSVCGAVVACGLVHGLIVARRGRLLSTCVDVRGLGCFVGGGWLVGWSPRGWVFVCPRARGGCLWVSSWGGVVLGVLWVRDRGGVSPPLVSVWVVSCERACLREVCGWVWDVEGVAFAQELFGLVCGDDATADGWPLFRVFSARAYGEELGGELWCGYGPRHVFAVWAGVAECGVLGEWSDGVGASVGFERECGGDVADGVVAEVWFSCGGGFVFAVVVLAYAVVRSCACFCVRACSCVLLLVQVVGVLVPGGEYGVV